MPEDDRQPSRERGDKRADRTGANSRDNLRYKGEDDGRRRDRGGDPGRSSSRPGQPDVARDGRGSSRDGPDRHARDRDRPADGNDRDYRRDDGSRSRGTSRPALPPPPPFPPGHGRGRGPPSNLGRPQRAVTPTNGQERENDEHRGTPGSGPRKGGTPGASHPFASEASNLLKQAKRPASTLPDPGSDDAEAGEIVQEQVGGDSRKRKHSPIVWNVPAAKTLRPDRQAALEPMGISERARQEIAALRETQLAAAGDDDIDPDAPAAMKRSPSLSDQEEHDDHHDANGHGSAPGEDPHEEPKAKGVMSRWANVDEEDGGVVPGGSSPGQEPSQGVSLGAGRVRGGEEGARTAGQGLDSSSGDEEQAGEAAQDVHPLRYDMRKECRDVHDFEKIEKISEGAYGVVYKAREKSTGRIVALKRVKMEHEVSGFPVTSVREINILLNFHHPNIVNVEEVVVSPRAPDQIYMVMEYADHDLKSLMEDKVKYSQPFSGGQVKNLMMQLLRGVEFLHSSWVIHRDLKTSNILYNGKGQLKLCDFGMARQYGDPLGVYTHNVVTLWYRAPELLFGCQEYSTAVDMWSVGCIMGEILTGKPVMPGQGEFEQIDKMVQLLGTPSLEDWPGLKDLSNYKKINLKQVPSTLRNKFTAQTAFSTGTTITEAGFDLLSRLLTWDPAKRITAREALAHRWFEEVPLPVAAILMPTFAKRKAG